MPKVDMLAMEEISLNSQESLEYHSFDLPRKQKVGVKKCWAQKCEVGEACRQFSA